MEEQNLPMLKTQQPKTDFSKYANEHHIVNYLISWQTKKDFFIVVPRV